MTLAEILRTQAAFIAQSRTCPHCWQDRTECSCPNHVDIRKG